MKRVLGNFFWSTTAKIVDAGLRFFAVPLVLHHYGKLSFGLMALAASINVFLQIMDFGLNIGAVRYFSERLEQKDWKGIGDIVHSSLFLYTAIGALNLFAIGLVSVFSESWFDLNAEQLHPFRVMLVALALQSLVSWTFSIFKQLVAALGEVGWDERNGLITSIISFAFAPLCIWTGLSIEVYFSLTMLAMLFPIALRLRRCKAAIPGLQLRWRWDWKKHKDILFTSGLVFLMSTIQFSASNLRPFILANQSNLDAVAEYRIIQQIANALAIIGAGLFSVIYPEVSRLNAQGRIPELRELALRGTRLLLLAYTVLCGSAALASPWILELYLGTEYQHLSGPLAIWLLTVGSGHIAILSSIALLQKNLTALTISSAVSAATSLILNVIFAKQYGIWSATLCYALYMCMQIAFYYIYLMPKLQIFTRILLLKKFAPLLTCIILFGSFIYASPISIYDQPVAAIGVSAAFILASIIVSSNDINYFRKAIAMRKA